MLCRANDRVRGHEDGHGDDGRDHVSGHGRGNGRVHVNAPSCGHGGASCRLRGHATRRDLICRERGGPR